MSSELWPTCLIYSGLSGVAKLNGKRFELMDNPELLGQRLLSIYYVPNTLFEIRHRPSSPTHEEMTGAEIAAANALIQELCG